tara:strand:+ start:257 stop:481 length:225 start_codon:yes stop_codon:yes gene_type:complete
MLGEVEVVLMEVELQVQEFGLVVAHTEEEILLHLILMKITGMLAQQIEVAAEVQVILEQMVRLHQEVVQVVQVL